MKKRALLLIVSVLAPLFANAAKFMELKVLDKDYLMLLVRDGEIRYRDDGTGPSAYLGVICNIQMGQFRKSCFPHLDI